MRQGNILITVPELLDILAVPHMQAAEDLDYILKKGSDFGSASQGQARYLVQTIQFKNWLHSPRSELLIVDANLDFHQTDKISPISVIGATLSLSVMKLQPAISLHFFCGQHLGGDDMLRGPLGLLRSLISQLLLHSNILGHLNVDFITDHVYLNELQALGLEPLCDVFLQLIRRLSPDMTVFCIIDGISWYEQDAWDDGMHLILRSLNGMANDPQLVPRFKVLLTSTSKCRSVEGWTMSSQRISLSTNNGDACTLSGRVF